MIRLVDRRTAGRQLAAHLREYAGRADVTVLALPRGGVPVGFEIAGALGAPLDVIVVRKLGVPMYPEVAMGAIAGEKAIFLNRSVLRELHIDRASFDRVLADEREELRRREVAAIVVAAPVASREAVAAISEAGHSVVVLDTPEPFDGVSRWYEDFAPTGDEEVIELLDAAGNAGFSRRQQ